MARGLDESQRRELSAFVNAIAEAAGYKSTAEWSRDAGYPAPNLSELRSGKTGVDGFNLLRLLRAAAVRTSLTTEELALGLAQATSEDASSASIDARLAELSGLVTQALELLKERSGAQPQAERRKRADSRTGRGKRAAS